MLDVGGDSEYLMQLPKVYIAVLNWNGPDQTIACLESLQALDYPNYRVIVVDNASTDDSVACIRAAFPMLDIIVSSENLGYAGGNELAVKRALELDDGTGLFWILNNDTTVQPDTLTALVGAYQQYGEALYGGVAVQRTPDGRILLAGRVGPLDVGRKPSYREFYDFFPIGVEISNLVTHTTQKVVRLSGSNLLIPLAVIQQHGFIDTSFFLYSEDGDYCLRLREQGIFCYLVTNAQVNHPSEHRDERTLPLQVAIRYYQTRNRLILIRRYWGVLAFVQAIGLHLLYVLGWALRDLRARRYSVVNARAVAAGIRDAILNRLGKTLAPENVMR